ncbi:hypothetical protein EYF80_055335 [Liparis tanakae]|uniref:Uncharacterized protein n=1 Tax=Liparis tanakae TaxID=230148 RepID=A0A4Z2EZU5_9TELE|nr:hypothetical protein EYF80_055335 [Liparis tanakae]
MKRDPRWRFQFVVLVHQVDAVVLVVLVVLVVCPPPYPFSFHSTRSKCMLGPQQRSQLDSMMSSCPEEPVLVPSCVVHYSLRLVSEDSSSASYLRTSKLAKSHW